MKSIKRLLKIIGTCALIYTSAAITSSIVTKVHANYFTPVISTTSQLVKTVEEEQKKFGLEHIEIIPYIEKRPWTSNATTYRFRDDLYYMTIDPERGNTEGNVRHELCHIYYDDFAHDSQFRYYFLEEPRADLCSMLKD